MKLLEIHSREFSYKVTKPAIKDNYDKLETEHIKRELSVNNALVVFVTIEKNDDWGTLQEATDHIVKHVGKIKPENIIIYPFAHLSPNLAEPTMARKMLDELFDKIKSRAQKLDFSVNIYRAPFGWYKEFFIKTYGHPLSELSAHISRRDSREALIKNKNIPDIPLDYSNEIYYIYDGEEEINAGNEEEIDEYLTRFGFYIEKNITKLNWPINRIVSHMLSELLSCSKSYKDVIEASSYYDDVPSIVLKNVYYLNYFKNKNLIIKDILIQFNNKLINNFNNDFIKESIKNEKNNKIELLILSTLLKFLKKELRKIHSGETPAFPLYLSPVQAYVIVQNIDSTDLVKQVVTTLNNNGINRWVIDSSNRRIGAKIRDAGRLWSNFVFIIGQRELESATITVRERLKALQLSININDLDKYLKSRNVLQQSKLCKD